MPGAREPAELLSRGCTVRCSSSCGSRAVDHRRSPPPPSAPLIRRKKTRPPRRAPIKRPGSMRGRLWERSTAHVGRRSMLAHRSMPARPSIRSPRAKGRPALRRNREKTIPAQEACSAPGEIKPACACSAAAVRPYRPRIRRAGSVARPATARTAVLTCCAKGFRASARARSAERSKGTRATASFAALTEPGVGPTTRAQLYRDNAAHARWAPRT
jgi:hypothetical protein